MHQGSQDYLLPPAGKPRLVAALTQGGWRVLEEPRVLTSVRLLDSFDWGAYLAGALIEEHREGGKRRLLWHDLSGGEPALEQLILDGPGLARDLPPGPVQGRIMAAVGVRRLLPVVEIAVETQVLRLLDDEDKTLVRLVIEAYRLPGMAPRGAPTSRLYLAPLKGYEVEAQAVADWLGKDLALGPASRPVLVEALDLGERPPGGYSSKPAYRLDPAQRADAAARQILLGLLDTMEANIPGARANLDSEFLHDLRVATRRTRAALAQIPGVLAPQAEADFKARFAWLQQVTGPVRDLDVYLLDFDAYQASLPQSMRGDLEPLRSYLLSHYAAEQRLLSETLGSAPMDHLVHQWRRTLTEPTPAEATPINAARPIKALADERIWRLVRRVRKEGRAIVADSRAEELHELRKSCKKLRYLIEFLQSLYPGQGIGGAVKLLKVLLDNLGSFQDLAVQAHHLRDMAARMQADGLAGTSALLAMGALVAHLLRRQEAARESFADTFRGFDSDEGRALFRGLFHADPAQSNPAAEPSSPPQREPEAGS
jgi:CHAD domain-containing protein